MATTNPVFQVLVTAGNQGLLAADSRIDALANGQLGVFNFHTGLSVDGTKPEDAQDIFIAVGINRTSGGTALIEDFRKSSGQMIQSKRAKSLTIKGVVDEIAKVVDITGFVAKCDTDYIVKVEFRNQEIYNQMGYNQFTKAYNFHTGCCPTSTDCLHCDTSGDPIELVQGLVTNINADPDALLTASMFGYKIVGTVNHAATADGNTTIVVGTTSYTVPLLAADSTTQEAAKIAAVINTQANSPYRASNTGAILSIYPTVEPATSTDTIAVGSPANGVTLTAVTAATKTAISDSAAFKTAFPGASLGLRLTGNAEVRPSANGSINLQYHKTGTDFIVSLVEGFKCNGVATTITNLQYREGSGYDLQQMEYVAGGWNGNPGPYRTSAVTGLQKGNFEYFAAAASKYTQVVLTYDQFSVGGWLEYLNNLETIIAIPCADSTTLVGLVTVLDRIFTQFRASTNDVASMNCSSVNAVTTINDPALDGIESLS